MTLGRPGPDAKSRSLGPAFFWRGRGCCCALVPTLRWRAWRLPAGERQGGGPGPAACQEKSPAESGARRLERSWGVCPRFDPRVRSALLTRAKFKQMFPGGQWGACGSSSGRVRWRLTRGRESPAGRWPGLFHRWPALVAHPIPLGVRVPATRPGGVAAGAAVASCSRLCAH